MNNATLASSVGAMKAVVVGSGKSLDAWREHLVARLGAVARVTEPTSDDCAGADLILCAAPHAALARRHAPHAWLACPGPTSELPLEADVALPEATQANLEILIHAAERVRQAERHAQEAEARCQRSEELTRRQHEAMPGGIVHVRRDGAILQANAEALRVLGLSYNELTQRYTVDFEPETLHEDGTPCPAADYPVTRALETGLAQRPEVIGVRRPDATVSWAIFTAVPVLEPGSDEVFGAVVTFLDITQRKAFERALAESEARYRQLVESSPDPMGIVDDGRLVFVNAAGAELLGVPRQELQGVIAEGWVDPAFADALRDYVRGRIAGEQARNVEARLRKSDGSLVDVELSAAPLAWEGRPALLFVARDISLRKRAEQELSRLEQQLQTTQKLESLGVLAGGIAHDFNNFLAAILGNASLAKMHLPVDSAATSYVAALESAARQAADVTAQMLAYSGRGRVSVEPVDLAQLVSEMTELFSSAISKRVQLITDFNQSRAVVRGDVGQLRQVVMNLILNASDAMRDAGGKLVVRTGVETLTRAALSQTYVDDQLPAGKYAFLEVLDQGVGMDQETIERVFDPFFTTKTSGRGLGLAATLGIVRGHQGAVMLESTPGLGTRFRVYLPAVDAMPRRASEPPPGHVAVGDQRVLVIDDEPLVRDVTAAMLQEFGYEVITAESGAAGLAQFRSDPDLIDLVLLDLTMPDMSGVEVLGELQALSPDVRVILCSGYSRDEVTELVDGKIAGFLQKPYLAKQLINQVRAVLGG